MPTSSENISDRKRNEVVAISWIIWYTMKAVTCMYEPCKSSTCFIILSKGFQPTTWDLDQPFNHADIFDNLDTRAHIAVDLFFSTGMIPILRIFSRVWHPWGIIPPKKTPGVIPGYKWPSLNDRFHIATYNKSKWCVCWP